MTMPVTILNELEIDKLSDFYSDVWFMEMGQRPRIETDVNGGKVLVMYNVKRGAYLWIHPAGGIHGTTVSGREVGATFQTYADQYDNGFDISKFHEVINVVKVMCNYLKDQP